MPTLAQLRNRLAAVMSDGTGMRLVNETETIADRLELRIAEMEIDAGIRVRTQLARGEVLNPAAAPACGVCGQCPQCA